jgi:capsular exopolysaccharide synthesis family protein
MSIVDAIKKAKALGQDRQREDGLKPRSEREIALSLAPGVLTPALDQSTAPTDSAFTPQPERIEFAQIAYDATTCASNRVLVPDVDPPLMQLASPPYRMLRTRLLQRCRSNGWTAIAITSPGPGEGKSLTSLNLALTIAREGNSDVFLIDLDMRNPSICKYLGVTPRTDVVDYFKGAVEAHDMFFTVGIKGLTIAGSISTATNASELLATGRLQEMLDYIRRISANSLVLLDLPPVVNTDDALVVAPRVDATVLVVGEGRTNREHLQRALDLLADYPRAGVILNRAMESMGADYYGS